MEYNNERQTRRRQRNTTKSTISNSIRLLICEKYENSISMRQIANDLHLNYQSVVSIVNIYKNSSRITKLKTHSGRPKKINENIKNLIKNWVNDDCSITLSAIKTKLASEHGLIVSLSTINRLMGEFNYSFKRIVLVPERRNSAGNIETRYIYATEFINYDIQKCVFVDEMGVSVSMRNAYGRSEIGTTPRKTITSIRSKNFSVCAAITVNEVFKFKIREGGFNGESYFDFLRELFDKFDEKNIENAIIIADNVPFHKMNFIKNFVSSKGHNLIFLPAYSPQLNPIEEVFSKWKYLIKTSNSRNEVELLSNVFNSSSMITSTDVNGYVSHMREFLVKSVRREEF